MNDFWASAEVISTYSRKQAIEDGALKDITEAASNRGFPFAAAMTDAAWTEAVAWDEKNGGLQDEKGRLWDVVSMAWVAAIASRGRHAAESNRVPFHLYRVPNIPDATEANELELLMEISGGDDGEPVITIMLPHED
ncbi:hypothetical protein DM794_06110 [Paenarthrobacter ureafaciens]|uniref:DUF6573 family protein n=1 Tax=Paenarthrobacter ureafaciens TaxID=37931 RepID=UPI0015BF214F|nr:DUF6573 family protein [Paenarthrobacter ureafaciens]NWL26637.1 hypothetical protein [Paenarthrobacter ureafaciens]